MFLHPYPRLFLNQTFFAALPLNESKKAACTLSKAVCLDLFLLLSYLFFSLPSCFSSTSDERQYSSKSWPHISLLYAPRQCDLKEQISAILCLIRLSTFKPSVKPSISSELAEFRVFHAVSVIIRHNISFISFCTALLPP